MSLVLIKEDGSGRTDANSYASVADGDVYHEGHLYASAWTAATVASKEGALVMASRLIDASYQFNGWKVNSAQAMQWPRALARDPDRGDVRLSALDNRLGANFDSNQVPRLVVAATCEQARELLVSNRTDDPDGEGIRQLTLVGALSITFDRQDRPPVLSHLVQTMLAKLGQLLHAEQGTARLIRS